MENKVDHVFTLIGEYHLAPNHLPKFIKTSYTRILFNLDNAFFSNLGFLQKDSEYIKLDDDLYGIINTPSWIKWATYSIWEEQQQTQDSFFISEDNDYTEEQVDIDYQLLSLTTTFCEIMKLKIQTYKLSNFTTIDTFHHDDIEDLIENLFLKTNSKSYIKHRLNEEGFFYNYENSIFLIKEVTPNNLGECMGQLLFKTVFYKTPKTRSDKYIYRLLLSIAGSLSSLILNPKRGIKS